MSCKHGKIGNKSRIWISDSPTATPIVWDEILGAIDITPPDQARNTVDQPMLNQADGITHRAPGSRSGGDLTLNVQNLSDTNTGLVTAAAALASGDCVAVCVWPGGDDDLAMVMLSGVVTQCAEQQLSLDGNDTYAITIACNSPYKAESGEGPTAP